MKKIKFTNIDDKYALVDDEDFERVNKWKWYAKKQKSGYYAARTKDGLRMHRYILDVLPKFEIHHLNHNTLDNRKLNLLICTVAENQFYQNRKAKSSSIYTGVRWDKKQKKWIAQISQNKKRIWLGNFNSEVEAAKTYDKAVRNLRNKFAYTNF